ncbi:aldo/keto reductase [Armatimonas sp.]|uniref:aldo/keto reductase n=1 Tax=Armatimonas sp. TaxID=1872638 RepID=UPI00375042F6
MHVTTLGRTGLTVSCMGLGCGGHSRLGLATGKDEANAIAVVHKALDLGINFIDTAESYKTETAVGKALLLSRTPREQVVLSTKLSPQQDGKFSSKSEFKERFSGNLARLQTDYVDILHLHGVKADEYSYCLSELVPALLELRNEGKIRFLGITEAFGPDPQHAMLGPAVTNDNCWDVVMAGFNVLNQSARERVLTMTQAKKIGVLCMFAVRRVLSNPSALNTLLTELVASGQLPSEALNVFPEGDITELAYQFCRDEPGIDIVLCGTGNPVHLAANATALLGPALPASQRETLMRVFEGLDSISGN